MRTNTMLILAGALLIGVVAMGCVVKVNEASAPPPPPPPPAKQAQPAQPSTPNVKPQPQATPKPTAKPGGGGLFGRFSKASRFKLNAKGELELPAPVLFAPGTSELLPESNAVMQLVYDYLKAKPEITKLRLEGHTDLGGNPAANMQLSKDRAMSCVAWLKDKGTDCKRLLPVGFGETKPEVSPERTEDDKLANRRVVFVAVEKNGTAIKNPLDGGGQSAGNACP